MRSRQHHRFFHWKWLVLVAFSVGLYQHATVIKTSAQTSHHYNQLIGPALTTSTTTVMLPRLVIAGTARDVQPHLSKIQKAITRLVVDGKFQLVQMIWFENNSNDGTVPELEKWNADGDWNVRVISEDLSHMQERTKRLAHGRNRLWSEIDKLIVQPTLAQEETYILMMDMDDVNWHLSNAHECFNLPDWSVCCCNSYKVYYDLWALRTYDDWMPTGDYNSNNRMVAAGQRRRQQKPFRHISASHEPIPVKSCFGGAAIYKYSAIKPVLETAKKANEPLYSGVDAATNKQVCEHLSFHEKILTAQHDNNSSTMSLYIQPKFLNDGPADERMLYFGAVKKRFEPEFRRSWNDAKPYYDAMMVGSSE